MNTENQKVGRSVSSTDGSPRQQQLLLLTAYERALVVFPALQRVEGSDYDWSLSM
jgi:hypothetical protein